MFCADPFGAVIEVGTIVLKLGRHDLSHGKTLILASQSRMRAMILENAGVCFEIQAAEVDEECRKKAGIIANEGPSKIALSLAISKAQQISGRNRGAYVIGADQILFCDGQIFSKAPSMVEAEKTLKLLRGRSHELISAVVVAHNAKILWEFEDKATLRMRNVSEGFLDWYLKLAGSEDLNSLGVYRFEKLGIQLFEGIKGDYFTILGLPLIPLLDYLRGEGIVRQ